MSTAFQEKLHDLLWIGQTACDQIQASRPDLVVLLLHGGWAVYHAARTIWEHTRAEPFPPVLPVNIGREKEARYKEHRGELPFSRLSTFAGRYTDSGEIGYYLVWISQQADWITAIQEQVREMGIPAEGPQRILILDDCYSEGGTFYLAQQLFESSFPQAAIDYLAGSSFEWRSVLSQPWLEQRQVNLPEVHWGPVQKAFWRIATESADLAPDSLAWQPLHAGLPELQPLADYLPLGTWLELPGWICAQIVRGAEAWAQAGKLAGNRPMIQTGGFSFVDLLFRFVWKNGSITSAELARITGESLAQARRSLRFYYEYGMLVLSGRGKERCYRLSPRYDLNGPAEDKAFETFSLLPGKLIIGDYPGWGDVDTIQAHLALLREQGLELLVALEPDEYSDLEKALTQMGIAYLAVPVPDQPTDRAWIEQTVGWFAGVLQNHALVYLASTDDTALGLIAGCFLVSQGFTGAQVLRKFKKLRKNSSEPWSPFPRELRARKVIKNWISP